MALRVPFWGAATEQLLNPPQMKDYLVKCLAHPSEMMGPQLLCLNGQACPTGQLQVCFYRCRLSSSGEGFWTSPRNELI